jgi:rhamnopyranosyl-N-acetylglucosaminyl-diphospho-decaprenol beta-1,3/1,4-galactofuranosyltransferase
VDNGSTDDTSRWLEEEARLDCGGQLQVFTQANLGSSGGMFAGIKAAYSGGYDWFWCMDDDTIPSPTALEALMAGAERYCATAPETPLGWLNSVVQWSDGALHRMNEPKLKPYLSWGPHVIDRRYLPAQWCSFVSVLLAREAVAKCGLPLKDMFIWYDDVEYTGRIALGGFTGLVVLDSFVEHRTKANYAPDVEDLDEQNCGRFRYAFRNEVLNLRTFHEGRPVVLVARFVRLMLRRIRLMVKARKFRYLYLAVAQAWKGLTMERRIEFPTAATTLLTTPIAAPENGSTRGIASIPRP